VCWTSKFSETENTGNGLVIELSTMAYYNGQQQGAVTQQHQYSADQQQQQQSMVVGAPGAFDVPVLGPTVNLYDLTRYTFGYKVCFTWNQTISARVAQSNFAALEILFSLLCASSAIYRNPDDYICNFMQSKILLHRSGGSIPVQKLNRPLRRTSKFSRIGSLIDSARRNHTWKRTRPSRSD
jgi:hypothetical protein